MNNRLYRLRAIWLLAVGAASITLVLATYGPNVSGQPGPSPVSPLPAIPWAPTPEPVSWWDRMQDTWFWMSPLPWVAVGVVLFGILAGVLIRTFRHLWPRSHKRAKRPDQTTRTT